MKKYLFSSVKFLLLVFVLAPSFVVGLPKPVTDDPKALQNFDASAIPPQVYIVKLKGDALQPTEEQSSIDTQSPSAEGFSRALSAPSDQFQRMSSQRNDVMATISNDTSEIIHDYRHSFNGFATRLDESELAKLKANPNVERVWKDEIQYLHTDTSPKYLGISDRSDGAWSEGFTGEDVVIGVIDSGINPEHPSVDDFSENGKHKSSRTKKHHGEKGLRKPYGPPPKHFVGSGCDFGNMEFNPMDAPFECNNKLLKATYFVEGYLASLPEGVTLSAGESLSARDSGGHGTHTATTAAGNWGVRVPDDEDSRKVSGIAPRARLAIYKVCWSAVQANADGIESQVSGCATSDIMAAIDQAIADGVDVLNISLGSTSTQFGGPDDESLLVAAETGVWVATSQGNSGPLPQTTGTPSGLPWVTSVGATQDNNVFATGVEVVAPASIADTYVAIEGLGAVSLDDAGTLSGSILPVSPADGCAPLTNPESLNGNIALIIRGGCNFTDKYINAQEAGATALVVYNDGTAPDRLDPFSMGVDNQQEILIPGVMVSFSAGDTIAASDDGAAGSLSPDIKLSRDNRVASFSSRGPNGGAPDIIKPDIAAPGVSILAGFTETPNQFAQATPFAELNGTSMSSPHVAGVFAMLKQAHPDWTPAMGRSALMTTARNDLQKSFQDRKADPFDIGAGHIQANKVFDPGLVYDVDLLGYLAFSCGSNNGQIPDDRTCNLLERTGSSLEGSDLNLPSIGVASLLVSKTVTRTVTSVAPGKNYFKAKVKAPKGIKVKVKPSKLKLKENETASYEVTFTTKKNARLEQWDFGSLTWKSKHKHHRYKVRSPLAVRAVPFQIAGNIEASGTEGHFDLPAQFGYRGDFSIDMNGLAEGTPVDNIIADLGINFEIFTIPEGTTLSRFSLYNAEVGDGNEIGNDLDLVILDENFNIIDNSGNPASDEEVNLVNPAPGIYVAAVIDFLTDPGETAYTLYNYNLNGSVSNIELDSPSEVDQGSSETIQLDWENLNAGTRYLGIMNYANETQVFGDNTEVLINTRF